MHLTPKDKAFIASLALAWGGLVLVARWRLNAWVSDIALGLTMVIVLGALFETYRRLLAALKQYHGEPTVNYRQVESLFSLFASLPIDHPLPPMRGAAISPDFANSLVGLILETRPRTILELGSGLSTLITAYGLKRNGGGRIVSLEQDARYAEVSERNLADRGLQDVARVIHAPLREVALNGRSWAWYDTASIETLEDIDLLIVDGPLQEGQDRRLLRYPALPLLNRKLGPRAAILLDDGHREDERRVVELWTEEFPQFVREDVPSEKGTIILRRKA